MIEIAMTLTVNFKQKGQYEHRHFLFVSFFPSLLSSDIKLPTDGIFKITRHSSSNYILIMYQFAITLSLALSSFITVQGQDQNCLNCICQATSCYSGIGCHGSGVGRICGPFLITFDYWFEGGQPSGSYHPCANDRSCAEEAVRGYVRRYGRDCDGNGVVDCNDYARIHKMGYVGCSDNDFTSTAYWRSFQQCYGDGGGGGGGGGFDDDDDDEP